MKHPHCNRSKAAHLFWCRGFAPVVFILAIALIVVAIGSGIYFGVSKETAQAPSPQDIVASSSTEATMAVAALPTTTEVVSDTQRVVATTPASIASPTPTVAPVAPVKPIAVSASASYDCGSGKTAEQCFAERLTTCAPAKATVVDPASGLTAERLIDGYKGNACSYRTNILSGEGNLALLAGMQINCLLPKTLLSSGVSMSKEDMLSYCTGSFIDLLREQMQ